MCSFLPKDESDRCNLSRQGEASHRRLHAFREQALVEIVERSLAAAGPRRRTLEDGFHIVIMLLIEPKNLLGLFRTLQLSAHSCRLLRNRCGVCIRAISRAARIGPIEGIWRSNLVAFCLRLSANRSFRTAWRNSRRASSCW